MKNGDGIVPIETILAVMYKNHQSLFQLYQTDFPNPDNYVVDIKIVPCTKLDTNRFKCLEKMNEDYYSDNFNVTGGQRDLQVAWFMNVFTIQCGNEFQEYSECGTFLEIHRPFDENVIAETRINQDYSDGYLFGYLSLRGICAGRYEVIISPKSPSPHPCL